MWALKYSRSAQMLLVLGVHRLPIFFLVHSLTIGPSSPHPSLLLASAHPPFGALVQEPGLEGLSYLVFYTSGDSRQAQWVAQLSDGCPASSPAAKAAGRGHFSSALPLPLALLSCQIKTAMTLPIPWFSVLGAY